MERKDKLTAYGNVKKNMNIIKKWKTQEAQHYSRINKTIPAHIIS